MKFLYLTRTKKVIARTDKNIPPIASLCGHLNSVFFAKSYFCFLLHKNNKYRFSWINSTSERWLSNLLLSSEIKGLITQKRSKDDLIFFSISPDRFHSELSVRYHPSRPQSSLLVFECEGMESILRCVFTSRVLSQTSDRGYRRSWTRWTIPLDWLGLKHLNISGELHLRGIICRYAPIVEALHRRWLCTLSRGKTTSHPLSGLIFLIRKFMASTANWELSMWNSPSTQTWLIMQ